MSYDIEEVAKKIEWPVKDWPGNCYAVACAMLDMGALEADHEDAKKRYGHWTGPVDPKAPIFGDRKTPFQRHGWLEVPGAGSLTMGCYCGHLLDEHASGFFRNCESCDCVDYEGADKAPTIIDPTRWVFENATPYIYVGEGHGHYDVGGNQFRMAVSGPPPVYDATAPRSKTAIWSVCGEAHRFVLDRLFNGSPGLTQAQEMWLANADPAILGKHAKPIFQALCKAGLEALIPIDNRRLVMDPADPKPKKTKAQKKTRKNRAKNKRQR